MTEYLPRKHESLSLYPSTAKNKNKKGNRKAQIRPPITQTKIRYRRGLNG
jgi:hypothetical protein